jgi:hypothetical protein
MVLTDGKYNKHAGLGDRVSRLDGKLVRKRMTGSTKIRRFQPQILFPPW